MSETLPKLTEDWLNFRVTQTPELIALVDEQTELTFAELETATKLTTTKIREEGITNGDKVAVIPENKISFPIFILAIWEIGAVPVLLHKRWTDSEKEKAIRISTAVKLADTNSVVINSAEKNQIVENENGFHGTDETAVIIFTSGTTSTPKGVEITFGNLYSNALLVSKFFRSQTGEKWLASLPFYHIGGFAMITRALILGHTLTFPSGMKLKNLNEALKRQEIDYASLVPTQLSEMTSNNLNFLKKLKAVLIGGGPSEKKLIEKSLQLNIPIAKVYGSTETCSFVAALKGKDLLKYPDSSGRAIPPAEIKILREDGTEAEPGEAGEIVVKSPTIAKRYLNMPVLTSEKFRNEYFRTGDFGYLNNENFLFVLSRREDLIVTGGENVSPAEVKEALLKIEGVEQCFVLPLKDAKWGEIVAAIVVGKTNDANKIKHELRLYLADYKIPKKIVFTNSLPTNSLGKIDRQKALGLFDDSK